jgi:signal transduction histidine kinase
MDSLIADVSAASRLSRSELRPEPTDLGRVVREALAHQEASVTGREASIRVEDPLPNVLGHHSTLVRVVSNLVDNALKFVGDGVRPRVYIWAETRGERVRVWVEDNGIGLPAAERERIFDEFERLHDEANYPGTGLGLSIVRRALERMGGRSGVESEVGRGSRFWIELPAATTNHPS